MEIKTESSENLESYDQSLSDLQLTSEHPLLDAFINSFKKVSFLHGLGNHQDKIANCI